MENLTKQIKQAVETLNGFKGLDKLYWLNAMIELEELTKSEAGYIIINKLI